MERMVYGARIGSRWAFVVSARSDLFRFEDTVTTAEYPCRWCGGDQMRLQRTRRDEAGLPMLDPRSDTAEWRLRCEDCGQAHLIAQMPARQCQWQPPAWAVDLDERDAHARYGMGE